MITEICFVLIFSAFWILIRSFAYDYYMIQGLKNASENENFHEKATMSEVRAKKISGNISSTISGFSIILLPFLMMLIQVITGDNAYVIYVTRYMLLMNISYNLVDSIDATLTFRLHHVLVIAGVCVAYNIVQYNRLLDNMIIYSLTELSNVFIWWFYHRIQTTNKYPTSNELVIQLNWYVLLRTVAFILAIQYTNKYWIFDIITVYTIVVMFSTHWAYALYKKIGLLSADEETKFLNLLDYVKREPINVERAWSF